MLQKVAAPFCRATLLRVEPGFSAFREVPAELFLSLGVNLRGRTETSGLSADVLRGFAEQARMAGLRCHVHGLESTDLTTIAARAGFDYVGSDVLSPPLEASEPEPGHPDAARLLRQLLGR